MDPSSTVRCQIPQRVPQQEAVSSIREYRQGRQHLYPLEIYRAAQACGGTVRSYCGIGITLVPGDSSAILEVDAPEPDDCVTCVDAWRGSDRVRL